MPDHPGILQNYIWQQHDLHPPFPELRKFLDFWARELDGLLGALMGLLGPLLIVLMGLFVMGIVFAMLLPIFEMNQLIH